MFPGVTPAGMESTVSAACRCRAAATERASNRGSASVRQAGGGASVTKVSGGRGGAGAGHALMELRLLTVKLLAPPLCCRPGSVRRAASVSAWRHLSAGGQRRVRLLVPRGLPRQELSAEGGALSPDKVFYFLSAAT